MVFSAMTFFFQLYVIMVITVWLFLCEQLLLKVIISNNLTFKPQKIILDALHWENAQWTSIPKNLDGSL